MKTTLQIANMESELQRLKNENSRNRMKCVEEFNKKINQLINSTPTGELRDELCELNILYISILETII